jgi:ABC-2 type transport system ATP-binding protein
MIKVQNLTKQFGPKTAVSRVSFTVERGEVLGFLGPNGAGKSTTMRMLTGFIPPSEGSVQVGSFDMLEQPIEAKRLIGYLPENAPLYADMTVHGFLAFAAEMRGFSGDAKKQAVQRAVEMCFLESVLHQSIDTLSKGYRHRTCFAQSVIHDPDVRRMGQKKAIIFSTHILEEVEAACTRAIIIDRGQIVANGSPQELKQKSEMAGAVTVHVLNAPAAEVKQRLGTVAGARKAVIVREEPQRVIARVLPQGAAANGVLARQVYEALAQPGWKIEELHTEEGRLDEVFRSITLPDTTQETQKP